MCTNSYEEPTKASKSDEALPEPLWVQAWKDRKTGDFLDNFFWTRPLLPWWNGVMFLVVSAQARWVEGQLEYYREYLKGKEAWLPEEVELLGVSSEQWGFFSYAAFEESIPMDQWAKRFCPEADSVRRAMAAESLTKADAFLPEVAVEWLIRDGRNLRREIAALARPQRKEGLLSQADVARLLTQKKNVPPKAAKQRVHRAVHDDKTLPTVYDPQKKKPMISRSAALLWIETQDEVGADSNYAIGDSAYRRTLRR